MNENLQKNFFKRRQTRNIEGEDPSIGSKENKVMHPFGLW